MTGPPERDETTGVGRARANAAYVAARANRDVWPRNEKTGCVGMSDERTGAELLREAAAKMRAQHGLDHERHEMWSAIADWLDNEADSWASDYSDLPYYDPYRVAYAYLSAPVSAGEPTQEARDEQ